ncbi:unnamed protein product [Discosporangium mesarthrocarpum]
MFPLEDCDDEDEFDPILASIRTPPPCTLSCHTNDCMSGGDVEDPETGQMDAPAAGANFMGGILSHFPGDVRTRAGDVIAQSSAHLEKSAGVFRSAMETSMPFLGGKRKREGRGWKGTAGGTDDASDRVRGGQQEEDVKQLTTAEILNDEERRQLATMVGTRGECWGRWQRMGKCGVTVAGEIGGRSV